MKLLVVDCLSTVIKDFGSVNVSELATLILQAKKLNLKTVSFIDLLHDTYLNERQILSLKNELVELQKSTGIDKAIISMLGEASKLAIEEGFLKFESTNSALG